MNPAQIPVMEGLRLGVTPRAPPPFRGWPDTELRNQFVAGWGPAGFGSLSRGRGTLQHLPVLAGALSGGSPCVMGERPRSDRAVGPGYGSPGLAAFGVAGAVRFACARGWQHAVGPKRMDYRQGAASQHKARCGGAHRLTPGTCQAQANTRHVKSGRRVLYQSPIRQQSPNRQPLRPNLRARAIIPSLVLTLSTTDFSGSYLPHQGPKMDK